MTHFQFSPTSNTAGANADDDKTNLASKPDRRGSRGEIQDANIVWLVPANFTNKFLERRAEVFDEFDMFVRHTRAEVSAAPRRFRGRGEIFGTRDGDVTRDGQWTTLLQCGEFSHIQTTENHPR